MREMMRFPHGDTGVVGLSGIDGVPGFWLSPAAGPERESCTSPFVPQTAPP
jgi:hypothetical protein